MKQPSPRVPACCGCCESVIGAAVCIPLITEGPREITAHRQSTPPTVRIRIRLAALVPRAGTWSANAVLCIVGSTSSSTSSRTTSSKRRRPATGFATRTSPSRGSTNCRAMKTSRRSSWRRTANGTRRLRRGAQALGHVLRRRGEVHEAVQARVSSSPASRGISC